MTQRLWHESEILTALAAGASVVCASERLARAVRLAYADAARARGARVWERPEVLSWGGFLTSLFTRYEDAQLTQTADTPHLLGASQAGALWETMVRAADDTGALLQPSATAAAAQDAWTLCQDFRLSLKQVADYGSEDARQFTAWSRAFSSHCELHGWLDDARLSQRLIAWLADGRFVPPKNLLFAGFDEWTPLQMDLLAGLAAAGSEIRKLEVEFDTPHSAQRVICADADDELRAAAQWAAALLERDPQTSIGIVVQDLTSCREHFARTLDDALCAPARVGEDIPRPWNMSLGQSLGDSPLVFDALQLLEIGKRKLTFDTVSRLLRSPFLAGAETEYAARARFELTLRKGGEHVSIKRWLELARHQGDVPILVRVLEAVRKSLEGLPVKQPPSDWARQFGELLRLVGWPGERQTNSREYQTLDAFRELLGELARLDAVLGAIDYAGAASRLGQLASDKIFQPAAEDVPIQVLGLLEAAGLQFDHLWVLGLSDDRWPASPRPNPLLPVALQRRHSLPHASAQRELQFAQQVTSRLLASATDVVVSTSARDADQDLRPSPLIAMLPQVERAQLLQRESPAYARFLHAAAPKLEVFSDTRGPALTDMQVRGGIGILKSQAACPFQAFARYRLGAEALETPAPGLDAKTRGIVVHEMMEQLWRELGGLAQLVALNEAEREALIEHCITATLSTARAKWPEPFTPRFLNLEKKRLRQLLHEWLPEELERAPFEIAELEKSHPVHIGPLAFTTRVDRIDRFVDGGLAIIDYKTGDAKPSAWDGERPDEPQLPCYAVSNHANLSAVLFGVLRPGESGYRGYAQSGDRVPGIDAYVPRGGEGEGAWDALLAYWQAVLTRLATEFAAGEARVDPKNRNKTCEYCHLAALCRVDELLGGGGDDDDN